MNTVVLELIHEMQQHKRSSQEVILEKISQRLDKALASYTDELTDSYKYLYYKDSLNLLKRLTKKG